MSAVPVEEQGSPLSSALAVLREFFTRPADATTRKAVVKELEQLIAEPENAEKYKGFDLFWELYPKRDGRKVGKAQTRAKWGRVSLKDKRLAYKALKKYVEHCKTSGRPAMDPVRFLRTEIWRDFLEDGDPITRARPLGIPEGAIYDPNTGQWHL